VEFENVCDGLEGHQTESRVNSRFGSTGNKEFDIGDLVHVAGEYGQDGGRGFFVLALVEAVDDDESLDAGRLKWTDDEFLHLEAERLSSDVRVRPQELE